MFDIEDRGGWEGKVEDWDGAFDETEAKVEDWDGVFDETKGKWDRVDWSGYDEAGGGGTANQKFK